MQISPIPNSTWASPAAASQQASADQRTHSGNAQGTNSPHEAIVDVERSTETLDRDANGQYDGSSQNPKKETPRSDEAPEHQSLLELPAENDVDNSTLDLMG